MKICAVIILFNPEQDDLDSVLSNIKSYSNYVEKLYLVDNSPIVHENLFGGLPNTEYIYNGNFGGLGGAQNKGCQKALADGYEWCMTMDQDTEFNPEQIKEYIRLVNLYHENEESIASFSLAAKNITDVSHWTDYPKKILRPLKRKFFGVKKQSPDTEYKLRCIASANVISLAAWEKVGKFNEELFIDQVDYEFCYRLIDSGYKIIKFNSVYMNQHFGEPHGFTLFRKHYAKYGKVRFYHCIRNSFAVKRKYRQYNKFYNKYLADLFFDNCVNSVFAIKNLFIFIKAYKDSKFIKL